jgi:hypothetical protein
MNRRERHASAEHRLIKEAVAAQEHHGISASTIVRPIRRRRVVHDDSRSGRGPNSSVVWTLDQNEPPARYLQQSGGTTVRTTQHSAGARIEEHMAVGWRTRFGHSECVMQVRMRRVCYSELPVGKQHYSF